MSVHQEKFTLKMLCQVWGDDPVYKVFAEKDQVQVLRAHIKIGPTLHTAVSALERQRQMDPGIHWPASLAKQ